MRTPSWTKDDAKATVRHWNDVVAEWQASLR